MSDSVERPVVIVNGAGSGIGRETAILAARAGAHVVATDVKRADETAAAITDATLAGHGKIDGLRNVAGIVVGGAYTAVDLGKEQWERIIDTVPASIWRTRPDGTIDFLNACSLQYIGMTMQEGLDAGCRGQIHPDDYAHAHSNWLSAMARRKPFECVVRVRRFDGEYRWFLSRAVPLLDDAGNVIAWYGSDADIHDRKLAEDALLRARADLAHVARVTTLGELSASIAHEVNQPLAAIVTNGEVSLRLLDRDVVELTEVHNALEAMVRDGRRASDIIQRLRTLTTKTKMQKAELDLNEVVADVVPLVRDEMLDKRVTLRLELAPALPAVLGDRVQLQQVIINLLVNGVDSMASILGRSRDLTIRSQRHGPGQILVSVRDSGVGIDPQDTKRIFEAFHSTKPKGMGMGLSICRSIVESHGGKIWGSPNEGPGATFQFALPTSLEQAA
jgi:PAS domain S-box-containing protein